ncbi:hypothetical protein C8Q74DRAFT_1372728 [Fomes fomentarius]|nr:hypothetical protein C8Q74DRAFT_1372728 [Fomes fomentarius]
MPHSIPLLTVTPYTESSLQPPYADASGPVMLEESVSADADWPQLLPESWTLPTAWNRFYFDRKNDFSEEEKKRA